MHQVYLGLGSNIDSRNNLRAGIAQLRRLFGNVNLSSVYWSPAVGFDGEPFLNLVMRVQTDLLLAELVARLRALEYAYGRRTNSTKFSSRELDIDILTFDACCGTFDGVVLPRPEVVANAYVLCPFAELAPNLVLPGLSAPLRELWRGYINPCQSVTNVGDADSYLGGCPPSARTVFDPPGFDIGGDDPRMDLNSLSAKASLYP